MSAACILGASQQRTWWELKTTLSVSDMDSNRSRLAVGCSNSLFLPHTLLSFKVYSFPHFHSYQQSHHIFLRRLPPSTIVSLFKYHLCTFTAPLVLYITSTMAYPQASHMVPPPQSSVPPPHKIQNPPPPRLLPSPALPSLQASLRLTFPKPFTLFTAKPRYPFDPVADFHQCMRFPNS